MSEGANIAGRKANPSHKFKIHQERLLQSLDEAHAAYYRAETFSGPSLHFHIRALEARSLDVRGFAESAYALLTAWGMHRMGRGGPKMLEFEPFEASLKSTLAHSVKLAASFAREPS